jgi:hypothetical protein
MTTYTLGLFTNPDGYGMSFIKNENDIYTVLETYEGNPSINEILDLIFGIKNEYKVAFRILMNNQDFLEKIFSHNLFKVSTKNTNIEQAIFNILAAYQDKVLRFEEDIKDKLIEKIGKFSLDSPNSHHIVQSLFLAIEFREISVEWYKRISPVYTEDDPLW